jgi:hypothetical protein
MGLYAIQDNAKEHRHGRIDREPSEAKAKRIMLQQ